MSTCEIPGIVPRYRDNYLNKMNFKLDDIMCQHRKTLVTGHIGEVLKVLVLKADA